jgi:predicted transposase YdaD
MTLVNYIRDNQKSGMPAKKAIDAAVKRCIKENVLRDFLKKHRAEVMDVCLTEYNEEVFVNGIREDGRAEGFIDGRAEGLAAGRAEGLAAGHAEGLTAGHADSIRTLLRKGKSPAEIHDLLDYPMEEIAEVSKKLQ